MPTSKSNGPDPIPAAAVLLIAEAVLHAHPELRDLDWSACPPPISHSPMSVPASLMAPIEDFPDPPLDPTPLLERLEQSLRPHRPSPRVYADPMPRTDPGSFAADDAGIVAAFEAGFVETTSLLKGAVNDGSLNRLLATLTLSPPSVERAAARSRRSEKPISSRMKAMLSKDQRCLDWSAQQWAEELCRSKSAVIESKAWKHIMSARETRRSEWRGRHEVTPGLDESE